MVTGKTPEEQNEAYKALLVPSLEENLLDFDLTPFLYSGSYHLSVVEAPGWLVQQLGVLTDISCYSHKKPER